MPRIGLNIQSTYRPMSFEEYAAPFLIYQKAYQELADKYDDLQTAASVWEKLKDNEADAPEYAAYKQYADTLNTATEDFLSRGFQVGNARGRFADMRKQYGNVINPIEERWNYREKMAEEQRKLNPKGDMQWDVDYGNVGLSNVAVMNRTGYKGRSLDDLEKEGFEQAKAASSRKVVVEKSKEMANQYYAIEQGYGTADAQAWLRSILDGTNPESSNYSEITELYQQIRKSRGTDTTNIFNQQQNNIADDRIISGIMKGLDYGINYNANSWAQWHASSGSGSGSSKSNVEIIGYQQTLGNDTYTVVDEGGKLQYYNDNGELVNLTDEQRNLAKSSKIIERYYTVPHNNNADLVYVYDAATGMPVTQDNGNVVSYNRKTQYWDAKTKTVKDKPNGSSGTQYKIQIGKSIVSRYTMSGDLVSAGSIVSSDKVPDLASGTIKHYDGTQFIGDNWEKNTELKDIYDKLDQTVKSNPEAYSIQYGRVKNSHDRAVIATVKQNYSSKETNLETNLETNQTVNESDSSNKLE